MAKVNKISVSEFLELAGFETIDLQIELGGQSIAVSIQAIDGKLRVLTGPQGTALAPLTFPSNQSIGSFGCPED